MKKIWVGIKVFTCVVSINPTTISKGKISLVHSSKNFITLFLHLYPSVPRQSIRLSYGQIVRLKIYNSFFNFCSVFVGAVGNKSHVCLLLPRLYRHVIDRFSHVPSAVESC
ncbi:hypothetical protein AtNW77_Chr4g0316861 [Arabidopsis thaliana]